MFCPSCGALVDDGLSFCSQCGSLLSNTTPQYPSEEDHPTELFSEDAFQPVTDYDPPQNVYQGSDYSPVYSNAPTYNQAPPVYQNVQPIYNQYNNAPAYNHPNYVGYADTYAGVEPPKRDPGRVCGILSLIFSLVGYPLIIFYGLGLYLWLAALILGIIGSKASKRNGFKNGKAKAGIIITLIPLIMAVVSCAIGLVILLIVALTEGF